MAKTFGTPSHVTGTVLAPGTPPSERIYPSDWCYRGAGRRLPSWGTPLAQAHSGRLGSATARQLARRFPGAWPRLSRALNGSREGDGAMPQHAANLGAVPARRLLTGSELSFTSPRTLF